MVNKNLRRIADRLGSEDLPREEAEEIILPTSDIDYVPSYVLLESRFHGDYIQSDLLVGLHRLKYVSRMKGLNMKLPFDVKNTVIDDDGNRYKKNFIGNISYDESMQLIKAMGHLPVNLRVFVDFLKELRDGARGKKNVFDERGNKIDQSILESAYDEIVQVRGPDRIERLNDSYAGRNISVVQRTVVEGNGRVVQRADVCREYLKIDGKPGRIDLDHWLNYATSEGLPPKNTPRGNLIYWPPMEGGIRFGTNSYGTNLNCSATKLDQDSNMGIRVCKLKK